jgi:hypothetical protein
MDIGACSIVPVDQLMFFFFILVLFFFILGSKPRMDIGASIS